MDEFSWEDNITYWKDFSGLEIIGHGTFGTVYRASAVRDRVIGGYFALKFLSRSKLRKQSIRQCDGTGLVRKLNGIERVLNEINILRSLAHRNIVRFIDVVNEVGEDEIVLIMEYFAAGSLMSRNGAMNKYRLNRTIEEGWGPALFVQVARDILSAVMYLHQQSVCHRDIKPENLLLEVESSGADRRMRVCLCDFGCAIQFDALLNPGGLVSDTVGSPAFWPPESLLPADSTDRVIFSAFAADVWAIGVTLFCLISGLLPFYPDTSSSSSPGLHLDNSTRLLSHPPDIQLLFTAICSSDLLWPTNLQQQAAVGCSSSDCDRCDHSHCNSSSDRNGLGIYPFEIVEGLLCKDPGRRWSISDCLESLIA